MNFRLQALHLLTSTIFFGRSALFKRSFLLFFLLLFFDASWAYKLPFVFDQQINQVDSMINQKAFTQSRNLLLQLLDEEAITNQGELYLRLAEVEKRSHNFDLALGYIRKLESLSPGAISDKLQFELDRCKASILLYIGRFDQAAEIYYRLIQEVESEPENFDQLATLYNHLGNTLFCLQMDETEELYLKAMNFSRHIGQINFPAYNNIIDLYTDNKNYKAASKYIDTLLLYADEEQKYHNYISGKMKQARLFAEIGQGRAAKALKVEYDRLAQKYNYNIGIHDRIYDSYVYNAINDLDSAIYYAKLVVEHSIEKNETFLADKSMVYLANLYTKSGNPEAAVAIYEQYIFMHDKQDKNRQIQSIVEHSRFKTSKTEPKLWWSILAVLALFLFVGGAYIMSQNHAVQREDGIAIEAMQKQLDLKNKLLTNSNLARQQKIAFMHQLKSEIRKLGHDRSRLSKNINQLVVRINNNIDFHTRWDQIHIHFCELFPNFIASLKEQYPKLTETELRHCMFIKLNLNNEEIARILNIEVSSVNSARYRLKKKVDLDQLVEIC